MIEFNSASFKYPFPFAIFSLTLIFTFVELEENEDEYIKLVEWLNKIISRDFFNAPLKKQSEEKLSECKHVNVK